MAFTFLMHMVAIPWGKQLNALTKGLRKCTTEEWNAHYSQDDHISNIFQVLAMFIFLGIVIIAVTFAYQLFIYKW